VPPTKSAPATPPETPPAGAEPAGAIYRLIPELMSRVGSVAKERQNKEQHYMFRGIDDIYFAVQGEMAALGLFVIPEVVNVAREQITTRHGTKMAVSVLTVKHTFYAPDGSSVCAVTVGEAADTMDKASNKAMSAAMKYALVETLCIPTEGDNDTENDAWRGEAGEDQRTDQRPAAAPGRGNGMGRTAPQPNNPPAAQRQPAAPPPGTNTETGEVVRDFADYGDLIDDEIFRDAAWNELKLRNFTDDGCTKAVAEACKTVKRTGLPTFTLPERHAFLTAVAAGRFDRFADFRFEAAAPPAVNPDAVPERTQTPAPRAGRGRTNVKR
jgi:hypothetical protein